MFAGVGRAPAELVDHRLSFVGGMPGVNDQLPTRQTLRIRSILARQIVNQHGPWADAIDPARPLCDKTVDGLGKLAPGLGRREGLR
ncbi:hypothetical protein D3C80_2071590 [compost metagenome]